MVLINVLDHVKQCYSNNDGYIIQTEIRRAFSKNEKVIVSFTGVTSLNSSFVNSAFIELLNPYSFEYIRSNLQFKNSTRQINDIIKQRFQFEVSKKNELLGV
ncbi:STAS-like domain-containing protein [Bacillus mycoides]|uniref:STAS-like domain-containing protein n=1 Tax=Bacillus mycoides TaxID=1405 RepID=UPI002E2350F6|nr:STAS-like domain-containing protein [Bacillus mycoides]